MRRALRWVVRVLLVGLALALGVAGWQLYLRHERKSLLAREAVRPPVPRHVTEPPAPLPPRATACISGLVLRDGAPVSGVPVRLSVAGWERGASACPCTLAKDTCGCPEGLAAILSAPAAWAGLVDVERLTRSDESGVFSVCGLDGTSARLVWAQTEAGDEGSDAVALRPGEVRALTLLPRQLLTGVVETSKRQPIAGASVVVLTRSGTLPARATTDAAGRFSVPAMPGPLRLVADAPGFATVEVPARLDAQPLRITLTAPARLEVRALLAGAPVAQVEISVEKQRRALTDAAGWARFDALAPDDFVHLAARKERLVGDTVTAVREGVTTRAAVTLVPGFVVTGRVVDEHERPRAGSRVSARDESVPVGPAGAFELPALAAGALTLVAEAPGCHGRATQAVDLAADLDVTLRLTCETTLGGVVVDAVGAPIANAEVTAHCGTTSTTSTTDADGAFAFAPSPGVCRLEVERADYKSLATTAQAPNTELRLVLDAGASVSGRVLDAEGRPVPGATVLALPVLLEDLIQDARRLTPATTDAQGRFTLGGLLPGRLGLYASAHGQGRTREQVNLEPGEQRTGLVLSLTATALLGGVVLDDEGRPVAGAEVWAQGNGEETMRAALPDMLAGDFSFVADLDAMRVRSGLDGRFSLPAGSIPGSPELHVRADGFQLYHAALPTHGPVDVRLVRVREARVTGRVVDPAGVPVAAFVVNRKAVYAEDGRFSVPRTGSVQVRAPGFASTSVSVHAAKDEGDADVGDVKLTAAAALVVTVRDTRGALVDGAVVSARQSQDASACTTAEGRCRLADLSPQKAGVTVKKNGFVSWAKPQDLHGPETTLEVTLESAQGALDGHALGPDGRPAPGLQVRFGWEHQAISDANGAFHFDGLAHADDPLQVTDGSGAGVAVRVKVELAPVKADVGPVAGGSTVEGRVVGSGPINASSGFVIAVLGAAPTFRGEELLEPSGSLVLMDDVARVAWAPVREGRFVLAGLPPGRWAIYLGGLLSAMDEAVTPRATVELSPGERRSLDVSP